MSSSPAAKPDPFRATPAEDSFWSDRFHACALAAGFLAAAEGRLSDSAYVREIAYHLFNTGAFPPLSTDSTPLI
jgi:hypothetical protein